MSKFKVGDRIAIYDDGRFTGKINLINNAHSYFRVELDTPSFDGMVVTVHPKQCRKLVKKERRRMWIRAKDIPYGYYSSHACISAAELVGEEFVEFIEVRRKTPREGDGK